MKKFMKSLALVAVAAMSLASCSNNFEDVNNEGGKTFSLTISAEKPALESDSRTEFSNGSVIWSSGDQIRACYYHTSGVWSKYYASTENEISADGSKATFSNINSTTGFPVIGGGKYYFYAGYPKNAIGGGATTAPDNGTLSLVVPTEQTMPKLGTFDANADIMVGATPEALDAPVNEVVSMNWTRMVAHGCVTLKNLAAEEGEIVKNVTFEAPVALTGNGSVNFEDKETLELDNNTVVVNLPANTEAKVAELPVWFCSAPATIVSGKDFTVTVETTRGIYTRTITAKANGIKFLQNRYNTLGINMASATFTAHAVSANVYKQITSMAELTTGEYVIVGIKSSTYYALPQNPTMTSSKIDGEAISVNNGEIAEADAKGYVWTITMNGNVATLFDGTKYLLKANSANTNFLLSATADANNWTVAYDGGFKFTSQAQTDYVIVMNIQNLNRFGPYKSSNWGGSNYSKIYLYKKVSNDPNAPSLSVAQTEVELENTECEGTIAIEAKNVDVINVVSNVDWLLADIENDNLYYIAEANEGAARTATVTLSAEGVEDVVVTFNQAANQSALPGTGEGTKDSPYDVTRAYAVIDEANGEVVNNVYVKGIVTDVVSFNSTYNSLTYHISVDGTATNKLQAYSGKNLNNTNFSSVGDLHVGDEVVIYGNLKKYNTTYEFDKNNYIVSLNCPHAENSTEQTITFDAKPATVTVGKTATVKASAFTTVTYSSSNDAVATIDANTGVVTGVAEGTVTITATAAAEGIYKQAIASYSLTVEAAQVGVVGGGRDDFNTVAKNSSYSARTTTAGWKGTNCAAAAGGTEDNSSSAVFKSLLGTDTSVRAFIINGKTSAKGTITSPTLKDGCGTLELKYGNPYSESNAPKFKVEIKQNGTAVKTFTVSGGVKTQYTVQNWSTEVNVAGDFQIVISNLSPTNSTSNKDRTAIWDVIWTGYNN